MQDDHARKRPPTPARPDDVASADRHFAQAVALFGTLLAAYLSFVEPRRIPGTAYWFLTAVFSCATLGVAWWVQQLMAGLDRRSRRTGYLGLGGSLVLALFAVLPWLNLQAQTQELSLLTLALSAVFVAVPSWIAAVLLARRACARTTSRRCRPD